VTAPVPGPGRRRQLGPFQRFTSRFSTIILVIVVLALGYGIETLVPDQNGRERPFVHTGEMASPTVARLFSVEVTDVRVAPEITTDDGDKTLTTGGVWIVLHAKFTALTEPVSVGYVALRSGDGVTYMASERLTQLLIGGRILQPGVPAEADLLFEVPRSALAKGLSARFAQKSLSLIGSEANSMDGMAEVPLALEGSAWLDPEPIEFDPAVTQK
jgi:hypothetical protein